MITRTDTDQQSFRASGFRRAFNMHNIKTKALTLLIEHGPCCIFSVVAGFAGLPFLNHNPALELGFALGGALAGEYIGHRLFHKNGSNHSHMPRWKRYGLSLVFGIASWGAHQAFLHDHEQHAHRHEIHAPVHAKAATATPSPA